MININNLHFKYGRKEVFNGLSLTLEKGNIYGLLGKNGTGKSTLFRNICGLLKPHKGSVSAFGFESFQRSPQMLRKIFLLPEEFHVPSVKVRDFSNSLAPFYPNYDAMLFEKLLQEFQIPLDHNLSQMSMGQKKKTLIAFSLSTNTELLLMDEPTNGLDIMSKVQFKKVMSSISGKEKCIVISTHQVKDIENMVDRITVIDSGNLLFDQTIEHIGRKLLFVNSIEKPITFVYTDESIKGYESIVANHDYKESGVDLELLYKAIMQVPQDLNQIFNKQ
ncbi:MAG TPA: ABC transporter ATP-binding protein [Cytophagales bacterium]|nr:ABC transporter ATP-binding protein [Cytophagales bacterium]